jgi:hypothetical protein
MSGFFRFWWTVESGASPIRYGEFMTMQMERRLLYIPVLHIDANLINARQKLSAINQLEKWFEDEVIVINMSGTARGEAMVGGNAQRIRKASQQIYTVTRAAISSDDTYIKVERALFLDGASDNNQRNDVRIICEAVKYAAILVTGDGGSKSQPGGILGNRYKLTDIVHILSPEEAVAFVREKIRERDEFNIQIGKETGNLVPMWTGAD